MIFTFRFSLTHTTCTGTFDRPFPAWNRCWTTLIGESPQKLRVQSCKHTHAQKVELKDFSTMLSQIFRKGGKEDTSLHILLRIYMHPCDGGSKELSSAYVCICNFSSLPLSIPPLPESFFYDAAAAAIMTTTDPTQWGRGGGLYAQIPSGHGRRFCQVEAGADAFRIEYKYMYVYMYRGAN